MNAGGPGEGARDNARDGVIIVGAGAVGLALAGLLACLGVPLRVLERRLAPHPHARSIGLHPPALAALEPLGVVPALLAEGERVRRGHAFAGRRRLGSLDFARLPPPHRYVLTLPQPRTEALLAARLEALAPGSLERGVTVTALEQDAAGVMVTARDRAGRTRCLRAALVVGCDGAHSSVRRLAGIGWRGGPYGDHYLMGDVIGDVIGDPPGDPLGLGRDAGIFLARAGVVESFPLPGGRRRWVVKTPTRPAAPDGAQLAALVQERLGLRLPPVDEASVSAFTAEQYLADRFVRGRVVLAGDAAHVLSPIGGQGMNLGWLDAAALAPLLAQVVFHGALPGPVLARYDRARRRAARLARQRAQLNMQLGRERATPLPRDALVRLLLTPPLAPFSARLFTMQLP